MGEEGFPPGRAGGVEDALCDGELPLLVTFCVVHAHPVLVLRQRKIRCAERLPLRVMRDGQCDAHRKSASEPQLFDAAQLDAVPRVDLDRVFPGELALVVAEQVSYPHYVVP